MENRTYKYFKGEVLYPFGYGLSYSNFKYSNLKCNNKILSNEAITLSVDIHNNSLKFGEEVVQCYVTQTRKRN